MRSLEGAAPGVLVFFSHPVRRRTPLRLIANAFLKLMILSFDCRGKAQVNGIHEICRELASVTIKRKADFVRMRRSNGVMANRRKRSTFNRLKRFGPTEIHHSITSSLHHSSAPLLYHSGQNPMILNRWVWI